MTVAQTIAELQKYPPTMEVCLGERTTDFAIGNLESIVKKKVKYTENPEDKKALAWDYAIVLSEEIE